MRQFAMNTRQQGLTQYLASAGIRFRVQPRGESGALHVIAFNVERDAGTDIAPLTWKAVRGLVDRHREACDPLRILIRLNAQASE